MSAVRGRDGRTSPPPAGGVYVRDPAAARAEAIRERVAQHLRRGEPVPPHLQKLFDQLPPVGDDQDVDLVDEKTGRHEGEVKLVDSNQIESTPDQGAPPPETVAAPAEVQAPSSSHEGSGALEAKAGPVAPVDPIPEERVTPPEPAKVTPAEPKPVPRRGRPPKKAAQE